MISGIPIHLRKCSISTFKVIFYQYQKSNKIAESEKVFTKFLLPVHQKFSNHVTLFQQFPSLTIEAKIKIYTLKILII